MSGEVDREQRKYEPSPRRIERAREQGQVAQSRDLSAAVQLATGIVVLAAGGPALLDGVLAATRAIAEQAHTATLADAVAILTVRVGLPALGVAATAAGAFATVSLLQTRFLWAPGALRLHWDVLDVPRRLQEIFGPRRATVRLLLAIGKLGLAGAAVGWVLVASATDVAAMSLQRLPEALAVLQHVLLTVSAVAAGVLLLVSALDYAWQRHEHHAMLRMTYQEMKEDRAEQEGQPEVRSRRRRMHHELTLNRIIDAVPRATVVVTNPTHLAVALRYRSGVDRAPVVTAKGADALALRIRTIARRHGVPVVEDRALARVLWRRVKVGRAVPSSLYEAVAGVLARVYRARAAAGQPLPWTVAPAATASRRISR